MENRLLVLAQLISNIKNEEDINTVNDEILSIFRTRYDSEIEQLAKLNLNTSEEEVKK